MTTITMKEANTILNTLAWALVKTEYSLTEMVPNAEEISEKARLAFENYCHDNDIDGVEPEKKPESDVIILSGKPSHSFTCRRCETWFQSKRWHKIKSGYSANCPTCGYAVQGR